MTHLAILYLLAASGLPPEVGERFWSGQVVAAFVAAGVALSGAIVTVVYQSKMSRRQQTHQLTIADRQQAHEMKLDGIARSFTMSQQEIDWRVRQLNELYGPLRMLRATSKRLRQSLPTTGASGARWRLVEHIPEARADPAMSLLVEAILRIDVAIEDLLINKAGLMEAGDLPKSFEVFMHHSRLLHLAWSQGGRLTRETGLVDVTDVPFPDEIDDDIGRAIERIEAALVKARPETDSQP